MKTFIGGPRAGVRGRGAAGKTLVAGAVEITEHGWGRARLSIIDDATAQTLNTFITANIEPGGYGDHRGTELLLLGPSRL